MRGLSGKYVREGKSAGSMAGTRQQVGATWAGDEYADNSLAAEDSFNPRVDKSLIQSLDHRPFIVGRSAPL